MLNFEKIISKVAIFSILAGPTFSQNALAQKPDRVHTKPANVPARPNAEYYSASPDSSIAMPVNIWGNVREPGLHFVPIGSTLTQSVSVAGGPTDRADLSSVRLLRDGKTSYTDLLGPKAVPLQENDFIYVQQNYRADLPLIFSGVSTVISIVTLYYVTRPKN